MSEKAPRSNPRLDNFEANKAVKEQEEFETALYGEAGTTDFSDEARARIEESDAYERHMERLAGETRSDFDRGLDRLESGEDKSRALGLEEDSAAAMHEEFKARKMAEAVALDDEFASRPELRQMDMISKNIEELRNKVVDEDTFDADNARLQDLENRLNDLLVQYEQSDDYNPAIADMLMDRGDEKAREAAGSSALGKAEKASDRRRKLLEGEDEPTTSEDTTAEEGREPVEGEPTDEDLDEREPVSGEPTDEDLDETRERVEGEPTEEDLDEDDEDRTEDEERSDEERRGGAWLKDPLSRLPLVFMGLKDKFGRSRLKAYLSDKFSPEKKKGTVTMVAGAIGLVALAGAAFYGSQKGWFGGGGGSQQVVAGQDTGASGTFEIGTADGGAGYNGETSSDVVPPTPEFSDAARTVHGGEGWLNTLVNDMGLSEKEAYAKLPKILNSDNPALQEWVYQMNDGNPGISHTGQLPQSVLESIKNL